MVDRQFSRSDRNEPVPDSGRRLRVQSVAGCEIGSTALLEIAEFTKAFQNRFVFDGITYALVKQCFVVFYDPQQLPCAVDFVSRFRIVGFVSSPFQ